MANTPRIIAILAVPGVQLLDVAGPLDVFAEANVQAGKEMYAPMVVGSRPGPIRSSSGVRLIPDLIIGKPGTETIHTLLVAGSPHAADLKPTPAVARWVTDRARRAKRYGSICSGAFLLGACGLLDGRRVTTHWAVAETLSDTFPAVTVEADALYVADGRLRTAAGVTAGLDLALALVTEDLGKDVSMRVASQLVMYFKRPGGQMQFSRHGEAAPAGRSALQGLQRWVAAHLAEDHSVPLMAERMHLSPRHFARLFRSEVGVSPAAWVEATRVEAARRLLESGHYAPKQVAAECGFSNGDHLRRAFMHYVGVSPADYRKRHGGAHD
ncbi:transcriptional regulator [Dyella lipolytica]|uniref:GlxA family transcriptional regulator n=1 Tax=Dyella lipolytica TaxID=1867835 RepID=A0ABW8IV43_9GAMM|nr:GlxA family transcriptional regulator [Dyella lipolytica]GLQ46488.1 transcriptional regulator [Dyella lipolytica]